MGELGFENILDVNEIDTLFADPETSAEELAEGQQEGEAPSEEGNNEQATEEVDPENLFEDEQPESVGSEGKEGKGDTVPDEDDGTSPQKFYSSIANALAVDGIFPNLDEETIKKADSAESLSDLIEAEVNARLDEKQQRVAKALENGVEPDDIRRYENTLNFIDSITEKALSDESEKGEQLRRNLIYQDFLNKGYNPEKAQKLTDRTIEAGTDVEDAKEALQSNKEFFQQAYDSLLKEASDKAEADRTTRQKQEEQLRTSIMKDKNLLGDMEISQEVRKKAVDALSRPVYKDPETGKYMTSLQKYQVEHREDFLKYTALIYTLTDGFKDFDSFVKGKVKEKVKKGFRELEQVLQNTKRNSDGSLKMVGSKDDKESYAGINLAF